MNKSEIKYIQFNTIFHPYTAKLFVDAFRTIHDSNQAIIPIEINSPGGYVWGLETMLDCVDTSEKPVACFCTGWAASCAAALAMSCTDGLRFCGPNLEFMIHQVAGGSSGKAADMEADSIVVNKLLDKYVYSRCDKAAKKEPGYTKGLIKDNFNADLTMFADEAIAHGFFDEIGTINMLKDMDYLISKCDPNKIIKKR